jgi:prepilin-type N-terminal cleavage/methylation domain-containing protein
MRNPKTKAFTLIELLVVIAIVATLLAIVTPALRRASQQATLVAVNADLRQIALALNAYHLDHNTCPPTREDCQTGSLDEHLFQLPDELTAEHYLPGTDPTDPMAALMEDRFHPGRTYKYRSVGQVIRDRGRIHPSIRSRLWVPDGFPACSTIEEERGQWYSEPDTSPVQWTLFSVGPKFDPQQVRQHVANRYPVPRQTWFNPEQKQGFIVRMRLKNGNEIGSFEGHR